MSHTDPTDVFVTGGTYRHRLGDPLVLLDGEEWDLMAATVTLRWTSPSGGALGPYACTTVAADGGGWYAYWDNPAAFFDEAGAWAYEYTVTQGDVVQKTQIHRLDVTPGL